MLSSLQNIVLCVSLEVKILCFQMHLWIFFLNNFSFTPLPFLHPCYFWLCKREGKELDMAKKKKKRENLTAFV